MAAGLSGSVDVGDRRVTVKKLLGEGGFAFVYLVVDAASSNQLVLKRQLIQNAHSRAAAERETQLMMTLRHPHIVRALGNAVVSGKVPEALILMEFCDGGHLFDIMRSMQV
jgi:serine/threonine protein kinase